MWEQRQDNNLSSHKKPVRSDFFLKVSEWKIVAELWGFLLLKHWADKGIKIPPLKRGLPGDNLSEIWGWQLTAATSITCVVAVATPRLCKTVCATTTVVHKTHSKNIYLLRHGVQGQTTAWWLSNSSKSKPESWSYKTVSLVIFKLKENTFFFLKWELLKQQFGHMVYDACDILDVSKSVCHMSSSVGVMTLHYFMFETEQLSFMS